MGYPMAKNLRAGLGPEKLLLICDVNIEALEQFKSEVQTASQGPVEIVPNGFEAVAKANTVITMLPGSDAVKAVYLDPHTGILAGAVAVTKKTLLTSPPEQKLIMECGTIETDTIDLVAKSTQETSDSVLSGTLTFVDAPVSGGPMFVHPNPSFTASKPQYHHH